METWLDIGSFGAFLIVGAIVLSCYYSLGFIFPRQHTEELDSIQIEQTYHVIDWESINVIGRYLDQNIREFVITTEGRKFEFYSIIYGSLEETLKDLSESGQYLALYNSQLFKETTT